MHKFIHAIPKVELHVHLEGTLEPEMLFTFAARNNIAIPFRSTEEVKSAYNQLEDLEQFLKLYYQGMNVLRTEQDYYELTMAYLTRAHQENIIHVEPFFDPQAHIRRGVSFKTVIDGIYRALREGEKSLGISFRLIMCLLRDESAENGMTTLYEAVKFRDMITGVGLDSDEINHPPSKFSAVFAKAREFGFRLTGHGGHDGPAQPYVAELVTHLNVERIDHGVTCTEDAALVTRLKDAEIPFTVCPISNCKIGPFKTMPNHPVKKMIDSGLKITINSDDPAYLGAYITENMIQVFDTFNLTLEHIILFVKNAVDAAFIDNVQKEQLHKRIDMWLKNEDNWK